MLHNERSAFATQALTALESPLLRLQPPLVQGPSAVAQPWRERAVSEAKRGNVHGRVGRL
jgi:hypothetical protein